MIGRMCNFLRHFTYATGCLRFVRLFHLFHVNDSAKGALRYKLLFLRRILSVTYGAQLSFCISCDAKGRRVGPIFAAFFPNIIVCSGMDK
jgi:hypothetical protein